MHQHTRRSALSRLFLAACIVFSLVSACSCGKPQTDTPAAPEATPITMIDCFGRSVEVPAQPRRVACLCPESGYALALFGKLDHMVAAVDGLKRTVILNEMYPELSELPVPKVSGIINIEELMRADPDVVFVKDDTAGNESEMDKLNKAKIPFLVVDFCSIEEQIHAVDMIGKVMGTPGKAKRYEDYYRDRLNLVKARVEQIPLEERVRVYHSVNEAVRTDAKGSLEAEWTQAAGAVNVSVSENLKFSEGKHYASLEQILLWDPEAILVNEALVADYVMDNEQWAPLKAVKNEKVFRLPNGISRWGHPSSLETPLVIQWTAETLYPEKFLDLDMTAETKRFYEEFFGLSLSDDAVAQILDGVGMRLPKS